MTLAVGAEGIALDSTIEQAFPTIDPGMTPLGARIILQLKSTSNKSKSGIVLVSETKEVEKWNVQTARVISLGPLAFRNRDTGSLWTEGQWVKEGDYVRISRWDGDRFYVPDPNDKDSQVTCVILNDHQVIAKITGNPLEQKAFLL